MGDDGKASSGKTWPDLIKEVWDKVAYHWSSWGLPVQALIVSLVVAVVVVAALATWGPAIKGLFYGTAPAVITSSPVPPPKDKPRTVNVNVTGPAQIGDHNVQHNVIEGPKARGLTSDQVATLTIAVRSFRGMRINIFQYVGEREIVELTEQITGALNGAGWVVTEVAGTEMGDRRSPRPVPGILVEVRQKAGGSAASALVSTIRSMGLKVEGPLAFDAFGRGGVMCQGTEDPTAEIQLTIGRNAP